MQLSTSVFDHIWAVKSRFLLVFFLVFTVSYGVLYALDWLPEAPQNTINEAQATITSNTSNVATATSATVQTEVKKPATELPISLIIPSLDRTVIVRNPETRDIVMLDTELLKGVVRHPDSGKLGEEGNVLILGHSSYLPNVMNKNYQAFNGIQKLKWGDTIELLSTGKRYIYRVEKVYQEQASDVVIPTEVKGQRLTLVTCNSFGAKEDRFIVEAKLVSEKAL